ncbi:hypothetical protein C922_03307 [Plasmodium inui San Antonio 1]|uniref:Uncharacterized protein n=1 Tax=Plasmodium inui San Antonio 1 TaxID=1237626 RepID=W7AM32_9APIC|nr:hypothetical protein C922_03307 [Plasmodium inui San Antonio 1]EUD66391.1 hypothetical protein C922_03307 [Plasmodium inui San Antonio 1]
MTSLKDYLNSITERAKSEATGDDAPWHRLRIEELKDYEPEGNAKISYGRWEDLLTETGSSLANLGQRAKMICQGLEGWMSNLELERSEGTVYKQNQCGPEWLGIINSTRDSKRCPYNRDMEHWQHAGSKERIQAKDTRHRTLLECMDIISILLVILNNISAGRNNWVTLGGRGVCQALYEGLRSWGGKELAAKLMTFWFLSGRKAPLSGRYQVDFDGTKDSFWSGILKSSGAWKRGLQCSNSNTKSDQYETVCIWNSKLENCEVIQEDQWNQHERKVEEQKGKDLIKKEEADIQAYLREELRKEEGLEAASGIDSQGIMNKILQTGGALAAMAPLSWYAWKRIFKPTGRSSRTKLRGDTGSGEDGVELTAASSHPSSSMGRTFLMQQIEENPESRAAANFNDRTGQLELNSCRTED